MSEPASRPLVDVRIDGVRTAAGPTPWLENVSVHVRYGEFFTVLGPSQSGKSALIRAVAGFTPLTAGRILIDGRDVTALPPGRRGIACVFQDSALWPHLTVREHIAFGLEMLAMEPTARDRRIAQVVTRLGLAGREGDRPSTLTLEQRRRLALARALAVEPSVLLLDEPLAHLPPNERKMLRLELAKLHRDLAVTTIHATRDASDALALSDRLAVMGGGRLLQTGDPMELYQRPTSRAVAESLGAANFLPVRVVEVRDLGVVVETEGGDRVPVAGIGAYRQGDQGLLVMRPETLSITEVALARGPGIPGRVMLRVFEGARHLYEVDIGASVPVRVELPVAGETRIFRLGDRVRVEISTDTVVLVPDDPPTS